MPEPIMTPQEKAAVMQFMGQTYGQAHKQDQMIIGQAGNLSPSSQQLKQTFEQTAKMPTMTHPAQHQQHQQHQQPPQQAQPEQPPQQVAPVSPEQAAQELKQQAVQQAVQQPPAPLINTDQLDLDFSEPSKVDKLIQLVKTQNLILKEISLKLDNGKDTKTNKQK